MAFMYGRVLSLKPEPNPTIAWKVCFRTNPKRGLRLLKRGRLVTT